MSWKLEQNIFPDVRRQVHAVVDHINLILTLKRQMTGPVGEFHGTLERLQATHTLTLEDQEQTTLHQQTVLQLLDLQIMLKRMADADDLVARVNVQLLNGQIAFQSEIPCLQMAQIYGQRHTTPA